MPRRLFKHISNYATSSLLTTIAGFVSFPLFARIFSVSDFGLMSIVSTTLLLAVGLSKIGFQHSIVRFYAETKSGKNSSSESGFRATVILSLGMLGIGATAIWIACTELLPASFWHDEDMAHLLRVTAILVVVRVLESAFINLLRAEQKSGLLGSYQVARKYIVLAVIIPTVLYVTPGANGFYIGTVCAEILIVGCLAAWMLKNKPIKIREYDSQLFRSMILFGAPMVGYEIGGILLSVGDRYVIQHLSGNTQLGLYAASYNVCEYVQTVILVSISQAVTPIYTRIWEEKGHESTANFISSVLHHYIIFSVLTVSGMAAVGHEMLVFLASEKYAAGATIIPLVISGMVLEACMPLLAAGIFINKKTRSIMVLVLLAAAANIALNYLLIPHLGLNGSALATFLSYVILAGSAYMVGRRHLRVPLPIAALCKFSVIGYVCYWVATQISIDEAHPVVQAAAKGFCLLFLYAIATVSTDTQARAGATSLWRKIAVR